jgi:hypothetical protein
MQKLIKRRMRSYLHPTGIAVRAYQVEWTPPPPPNASAPADNTRYVNPTPPNQMDQVHREAATRVALDALRGLATGAAQGFFENPKQAPRTALAEATKAAAGSFVDNCVSCHLRKK